MVPGMLKLYRLHSLTLQKVRIAAAGRVAAGIRVDQVAIMVEVMAPQTTLVLIFRGHLILRKSQQMRVLKFPMRKLLRPLFQRNLPWAFHL
jgi:hypothetical protein